jgi:hypothetical protein
MEFYLSFADLFEKLPNKIGAIFIPVFLVTILVEALFIQARHGSYPWKNTGISALVAVGHLVTRQRHTASYLVSSLRRSTRSG